jgi:hypothetical protein
MVFKVSGGTRQHNLISIFKLSRNQCEAVLNNGIYFYTSRVKVRMYFYKYGPIGTFCGSPSAFLCVSCFGHEKDLTRRPPNWSGFSPKGISSQIGKKGLLS